jgi:hypothetical protein
MAAFDFMATLRATMQWLDGPESVELWIVVVMFSMCGWLLIRDITKRHL